MLGGQVVRGEAFRKNVRWRNLLGVNVFARETPPFLASVASAERDLLGLSLLSRLTK
jgi:hypothetical protein